MIRVCRHNLRNCPLDTPNNVAVFVTCTNDLFSFKIGQVSNFPILSHYLSLNTITKHTDMSTTVCKQMEERSILPTEVLSCSQHKFCSSITVFPLFCQQPVYNVYSCDDTDNQHVNKFHSQNVHQRFPHYISNFYFFERIFLLISGYNSVFIRYTFPVPLWLWCPSTT
jgi:hypothetical protein